MELTRTLRRSAPFALCVAIISGVSIAHALTQPKQTYRKKYKVPIEFSAFIPMNNVDHPNNAVLIRKRVFDGDDREFGVGLPTYRTRQKVTMIPVSAQGDRGFEAGTDLNLVGLSQEYDKLTSLDSNGRLTAAAKADTELNDDFMKIAEGTADSSGMSIAPNWITARKVRALLEGDVGNPIPLYSCNITWSFNVELDGTDKSHPIYKISGNRSRFPAQEIYLTAQNIFQYDPRPDGRTVLSLCLATEVIPITQGAIQ